MFFNFFLIKNSSDLIGKNIYWKIIKANTPSLPPDVLKKFVYYFIAPNNFLDRDTVISIWVEFILTIRGIITEEVGKHTLIYSFQLLLYFFTNFSGICYQRLEQPSSRRIKFTISDEFNNNTKEICVPANSTLSLLRFKII